MNLHNVNQLQRLDHQGLSAVNARTWYRAVSVTYAQSPLGHAHTASRASRFNEGTGIYPMLYLAPDPITALLEFRALARVHGVSGFLGIKAPRSFALVGVRVNLASVVDFGCPKQRGTVSTSVQELTGDWTEYMMTRNRGVPEVRSNQSSAPTQRLGEALRSGLCCIEGFLAPSAVRPKKCNLVIFPDRVEIDESALTIKTDPSKARAKDESSREQPELRSIDKDDLVERLVRLVREDGGPEGLQCTQRETPWGSPADVKQLRKLCSKLEAESSSDGFVVRVGKASPLCKSEARGLVCEWLDQPDPAFAYRRPKKFLNCAERRRYFKIFVASLEGIIFS